MVLVPSFLTLATEKNKEEPRDENDGVRVAEDECLSFFFHSLLSELEEKGKKERIESVVVRAGIFGGILHLFSKKVPGDHSISNLREPYKGIVYVGLCEGKRKKKSSHTDTFTPHTELSHSFTFPHKLLFSFLRKRLTQFSYSGERTRCENEVLSSIYV